MKMKRLILGLSVMSVAGMRGEQLEPIHTGGEVGINIWGDGALGGQKRDGQITRWKMRDNLRKQALAVARKKREEVDPDYARFVAVEKDAAKVDRRERAFDGAGGFGAFSQGGRGGKVLRVTTLEDTGRPGSFRWAVEQSYPRIVTFDVAGTIELEKNLTIENPFITIDGSSAPKGGIALKDGSLIVDFTHDVVIRYIRVRPGDEVALRKGKWKKQKRKSTPSDGITISRSVHVIVDHCSTSWSSDEVLSVNGSKNVTIQWCFITEPLANPELHVKDGVGVSHAFGALASGQDVSYNNNLIAYFRMRGPQFGNTPGYENRIAAVNNYVCFYEESGSRIKLASVDTAFQFIGNFYQHSLIAGAPDIDIIKDKDDTDLGSNVKIYLQGNIGPRRSSTKSDEWMGVASQFNAGITKRVRSDRQLFQIPDVQILPVDQVVASVLDNAGAILPKRDAVDTRIIDQIKRGRGRIINSQDDVGGYPNLAR